MYFHGRCTRSTIHPYSQHRAQCFPVNVCQYPRDFWWMKPWNANALENVLFHYSARFHFYYHILWKWLCWVYGTKFYWERVEGQYSLHTLMPFGRVVSSYYFRWIYWIHDRLEDFSAIRLDETKQLSWIVEFLFSTLLILSMYSFTKYIPEKSNKVIVYCDCTRTFLTEEMYCCLQYLFLQNLDANSHFVDSVQPVKYIVTIVESAVKQHILKIWFQSKCSARAALNALFANINFKWCWIHRMSNYASWYQKLSLLLILFLVVKVNRHCRPENWGNVW